MAALRHSGAGVVIEALYDHIPVVGEPIPQVAQQLQPPGIEYLPCPAGSPFDDGKCGFCSWIGIHVHLVPGREQSSGHTNLPATVLACSVQSDISGVKDANQLHRATHAPPIRTSRCMYPATHACTAPPLIHVRTHSRPRRHMHAHTHTRVHKQEHTPRCKHSRIIHSLARM